MPPPVGTGVFPPSSESESDSESVSDWGERLAGGLLTVGMLSKGYTHKTHTCTPPQALQGTLGILI